MLGQTLPCILMIDPDVAQQQIVARLLYGAYKVVWTNTYADASGLLRSQHPRLLLLDVDHPSENPLAWLRRQRTDRQFPTLPLVCISAQASVAQKVAAFHAGADDFWMKPFPPATFQARVELLIRTVAMQRKLA